MKTVAFVGLLVASAAMALAQTNEDCAVPHDARKPVVAAFRILNTAEARFYRANGRYASLADLLKSAELKTASEMMPASTKDTISSDDDPLPGYNLRLILASDGKSYALTATKKDVPCRLLGATTDERGVIYLIEPLR